MDFFNEIWADRTQYCTLPLEAVGFTLTFIEVIFPKMADRIENTIDRVGGWKPGFGTYMVVAIFIVIIPALVLSYFYFSPLFKVVVLYVVVGIGSGMAQELFEKQGKKLLHGISWIFFLPTFGPLIILTFLLTRMPAMFLSYVIDKLNSISDDRALGSLGLILAFLGLLGEAYQYTTMVSQ